MSTLRKHLAGLAEDLNDAEAGHENTEWSEEQLLRYLNAGLALGASLMPKKFAKRVEQALVPGAYQKTGCTNIIEVLGVVDATGAVKTTTGRKVNAAAAAAYGEDVTSPEAYTPAFRLAQYDHTAFTVDPPAPRGVKLTVALLCATPEVFTTADLDDEMSQVAQAQFEIASEWAMYKALIIDRNSAEDPTIAKQHRDTFYQLLGLVSKVEDGITNEQQRSNNTQVAR